MAFAPRPAGAKPARPRDAASLILHRPGPHGPEVLMGRRAARHRFMPDIYVFPGGRLDPSDAQIIPLRPLRAEVVARFAGICTPKRAQALAIAAVREAHEETGLLLGSLDAAGIHPDLAGLDVLARAITPSDSPIRFHARFFIADGGRATGHLSGSGELLDLQWVPLPEALKLPLADVTEFMLGEVGRRLAAQRIDGAVPLWGYRRGAARVRRG
jgi:8-oxo-dGTP pyrophosphatase MutT (NUDIX family)